MMKKAFLKPKYSQCFLWIIAFCGGRKERKLLVKLQQILEDFKTFEDREKIACNTHKIDLQHSSLVSRVLFPLTASDEWRSDPGYENKPESVFVVVGGSLGARGHPERLKMKFQKKDKLTCR